MDRTFSIKTLGCKVNQYESSIIVDQFYENGWIPKSFGERADIVIINTCTVTERSDKKCRNYIRQGTRFSKSGKILVTGCLVDRDLDGLRRMPGVSAVFKNDEKNAILASANKSYELMNYSEGIPLSSRFDDCQPDNSQKNFHKKYQPETLSPHLRRRGFIKIQDGCDGVCAYCIVPTVRGAPRSRGYHEILEHSRRLIDIGCPELILTGISIGRYFDEDRDLAKLIEDIITLDGKFRVRISSIEPNHINAKLIDLFGSERLCPHIHLPLQSGSDRILQMMKRPYTVGDYIKIVEKIKSIYQNIAVGTDIIVGFPEENENDFRHSLKIVKDLEFSYVHQFNYSSRPGTPASEIRGKSAPLEIFERSRRLKELSANMGLEFRKRFIGKVLQSVIEKKKNINEYIAVSDNYIKIILKDSPLNETHLGKLANIQFLKTEIDRSIGILL